MASVVEDNWGDDFSMSPYDGIDSSAPTTAPTPEPSQKSQSYDLTTDIDHIVDYFTKEPALSKFMEMAVRVRDAYRARQKPSPIEETVRTIQETVNKLAKAIETGGNNRHPNQARSYAAIAGQGTQNYRMNRPIPTEKHIPLRHTREIILVRGQETEQQKARTYKELLDGVNRHIGTGKAIAIRTLGSGDMTMALEDTETRTKVLEDQNWLTVFGEGARIKRREFIVQAQGIRLQQVQDPKATIAEIYCQNPRLVGKVDILRTTVARRVLRSGRIFGPLLIAVAEPEQANILIDSGLIWSYELHECEPFSPECIVTQCFKCYKYGHVARMCKNIARCGVCAAPGHIANDCLGKTDRTKYRCVNCQENHTSWDRSCSIYKKQEAYAQEAYQNRPGRYQVRTYLAEQAQPTILPTAILQRPTILVAEPVAIPATQKPQDDWTTVSHTRTRPVLSASQPTSNYRIKKCGRPLGSTKASKNTPKIYSFASTQ